MSRRWMRLSVARARLGGAGMRQRGAGVRVCVCGCESGLSPLARPAHGAQRGPRLAHHHHLGSRDAVAGWIGSPPLPLPSPTMSFLAVCTHSQPCVLCICLCEFRECVWGGLRLVVSNRPFFGVCVYVHQKL